MTVWQSQPSLALGTSVTGVVLRYPLAFFWHEGKTVVRRGMGKETRTMLWRF